ncbi:hypothetical protein C8Q75DRAFT_727345, partial [Abortiporus biennis]
LFQLRSGHIPLRYHLHRIGKAASPFCPACHLSTETVFHFLIRCSAYNQQRRILHRELGNPGRSVITLLSEPGATRPLFRFIHSTGRFTKTFSNLLLAEEKNR